MRERELKLDKGRGTLGPPESLPMRERELKRYIYSTTPPPLRVAPHAGA